MSENSTLPDFDSLWDFKNLEKTAIVFDDLIPLAKESENAEYFLQLLTQIARCQGLQDDFVEAHLTLDEVQEGITPETPVAKIRYFLERGRLFNSANEQENAVIMFARAYQLGVEGQEDDLAVDAAHMMAIAEKDPVQQLSWNLKALALAEKSQDPKANAWLGSLYNNMGWTYHEDGKFSEALDCFRKGLAFREQRAEINAIRIAKWTVARALRSLNKLEEAVEIQLSLKSEFENAGQKDPYVFEELAELHLLLQKSEESKEFFRLAYNQFSKDESFKNQHAVRYKRIHELSLKR